MAFLRFSWLHSPPSVKKALGMRLELRPQESGSFRGLLRARPPHLDVALGLVQAVQRQLQVGAPARHRTGAGHVA